MELKTLQDIDSAIDVNGVSDGLSVFVSDLQKEAIKWVKERKFLEVPKGVEPKVHHAYMHGETEFIKHFFNLTEDDLNKKEVKEK
jgi:hypothetical protein